MKLAMRKAAKHKKKIAAIEKRYPIFGMLNDIDAQGKLRAQKDESGHKINSLLVNRQGGRKDADYTEMINFLDELDQKLSLDDFEESQIAEVHEFISKRMMADKN